MAADRRRPDLRPLDHYLIESSDPRLHGFDAAVRSHVDYLFELA